MGFWDRLNVGVRSALRQGAGGSDQRAVGLADRFGAGGLHATADELLLAELEKRRRARGKPANRRVAGDAELDALNAARKDRTRDRPLSKCYAHLELAPGASRLEVERNYRALLRKYHPDLHLDDPEAHRSALALCTQLTDSYLVLLASFERK